MPLAMHLTILVLLFAVKVCSDNTTDSAAEQTTKSVAQPIGLAETTKYDISLTTHLITTAVTSDKETALPSNSSQTTNRTEEIGPSTPPKPTAIGQTSNAMVSHGPTPTNQPDSESATPANTTSPGHEWGKDDFAANPGLVAVICIFCIITALVLVVVTLKCIQSSNSEFEKLEDVPMDKVNEKSPFAQYSK